MFVSRRIVRPPPSDEDYVYTLSLMEEAQAYKWRLDRLADLGVEADDAVRLALIRDVHHEIGDLIAAGCTVSVAVRIVR